MKGINNQMKTMIKICGVKDPTTALEAAEAGADLIGLVFHPASKRFVDVMTARTIVQALAETDAKAVAVFTDHSAAEMERICNKTQIKMVQLHGERARREQELLPHDVQRICVQSPDSVVSNEVRACDPQRDYLLFDHSDPGKGFCFDWNAFHYHGPFSWFLAGGLTLDNISRALQQLHPSGVDISSGVERCPGIKDIHLVKKFIEEVRCHEK